MRALDVMWGALTQYSPVEGQNGISGAWMPLSVAHQMRLFKACGMFDETYQVPRNPWCAHNNQGISKVFNQSYHSAYHTDSYKAAHFQDWIRNVCPYQSPYEESTDRNGGTEAPCYPFSQYGGTPVCADFIRHKVEFEKKETPRTRQLVYNRFGNTKPLKLGQQFKDTGLLQDMFSPQYRPFAELSTEQRNMKPATETWISNFLSYSRIHALIAISSCNQGTEDPSVTRIVRNLYRLHVDTYECMGNKPDDDGVPSILGFLPTAVKHKDDRPVLLYAGTLPCINSKLTDFCNSSANQGERVCQLYKQVYLNDATLLHMRMTR
jgi:hypothetical protein